MCYFQLINRLEYDKHESQELKWPIKTKLNKQSMGPKIYFFSLRWDGFIKIRKIPKFQKGWHKDEYLELQMCGCTGHNVAENNYRMNGLAYEKVPCTSYKANVLERGILVIQCILMVIKIQ